MSVTAPPIAEAPTRPPSLSVRTIVGLLGVFLAAMISGLNSRSGPLGLPDVRGALGFGSDAASWLSTTYSAGELVAMPFASWFAITFSIRRFSLMMLTVTSAIALIVPFVVNLNLLLALRGIQGITAGALTPLLMMAALKLLPTSVRLHGLALYAMTATFAPNVSIWIVGQWTDVMMGWRWLFWQIIPLAIVSGSLIRWGLLREPILWTRFSTINWKGLFFGVPALFLLTIGVDQGNRLDWFHSRLISASLFTGLVLLVSYLVSEWSHPAPFIKLQLLSRRNLYLGLLIFVLLLIVLASGTVLPTSFLATTWGYRSLQNAPIGLIIGLPQIVAGTLVAVLLYQKWADARFVMAAGLFLIALSCFEAAHVDPNWIWRQFVTAQALQAVGQPMAIVSMLFLATSVVEPSEGPYIAGCVNTLRVLSSLLAGALVNRILDVSELFHSYLLVGRVGAIGQSLPQVLDMTTLGTALHTQVIALATADAYRILGTLALVLVPLALLLQFIPAPNLQQTSPPSH